MDDTAGTNSSLGLPGSLVAGDAALSWEPAWYKLLCRIAVSVWQCHTSRSVWRAGHYPCGNIIIYSSVL